CARGRRNRHRAAAPPCGQGAPRPERLAGLHREPHRRDRLRPTARGGRLKSQAVRTSVSAGFQESHSSSPMAKAGVVLRASLGTLTLTLTPPLSSRNTALSSP